tara:strand:+ start:315 stop:626 length:312 start_codon:yes stop_codon:yes gene_type:complete
MKNLKSKVTTEEKRVKNVLKEYQKIVKAPTIEKAKESFISELKCEEKQYLDYSILLHKLSKMSNDYLTKKEISTLKAEVEHNCLEGQLSTISFLREIAGNFNK